MAEIVDFGLQQHKIKMDSRYFENVLSVVAGDTGRRIEVQLLDTNGMVQNTTGLNLRLNAVIAGKATFTDATLIDAATGKYQLDLSNGMFLAPGNWQFQWQITDSAGKKLHSFAFAGNVGKNISEGGSQATNFYLNLEDLKAMQDDLINGAFNSEALETNIAGKLEALEETYAPRLTEVTAQLAQTATKEELDLAASLKRDKSVPIGLNDAGPDLLAAVQNKEGETTFNLLSEPREHSVTPTKTTFLRESTNLYNPQFNTVGYVITADGSVTANPSYTLTGKFDLVEGMPVHYAGFVHAAFSDEAGNFIQRVDLTSPIGTTGSLVPPIGAKKVQFTFLNTQAFKLLQFNYRDELLPYEPYYVELENVRVGSKDLENEAVTEDKIKDKVVTKKKVNFIDSGTNLYNPEFDVAGQLIDAFGNIVQNQSYNVTGTYIVSPGETIHQVGFAHYAQFDDKGNFLRRRDLLPQGSSFTIPEDCHKIQYNYQPTSQYRNRQFNKGDKLLPYEPYEELLVGVGLSNAEVEKIGKKLDLHKIIGTEDRPMIDIPLTEIYEELSEYPEITDFGGNVKSADVYRLFDDLVALYPDYLKVIKTAADDFGNDIKAYSAIPHKPDANVDTKYPKIFITTGTHGYEHPPAMYLYLLMKAICENWESNSTLEVFRWNVEWIFIPVVNPSGWDDFTRKNRNGIDLNRNFPEGFVAGTDPSSTTYGGTEPLSEPESRFVKSVFDEHSDIDIMYDFHNFSGTEDTDFFIWIPTSQGAKVQHMSQMLISRMTRKWRKEYDWIPKGESWFAGYTDSTSGGMIADYARSKGINYSATFEVGGKWWLTNDTPYSVLHKQTGMEAFINWLQISLLEITK